MMVLPGVEGRDRAGSDLVCGLQRPAAAEESDIRPDKYGRSEMARQTDLGRNAAMLDIPQDSRVPYSGDSAHR